MVYRKYPLALVLFPFESSLNKSNNMKMIIDTHRPNWYVSLSPWGKKVKVVKDDYRVYCLTYINSKDRMFYN